jgi:hypothetical protein
MHSFRLPSGTESTKSAKHLSAELKSATLKPLARSDIDKRAQTPCKGGPDRTCEIDLPIESHEQLNCLHLWVMRRNMLRLVNIFVRQVIDRAAKDLQHITSRRSDQTAAFGVCNWDLL